MLQTIEALSSVPSPELALRLYLQCAEVCLTLQKIARYKFSFLSPNIIPTLQKTWKRVLGMESWERVRA